MTPSKLMQKTGLMVTALIIFALLTGSPGICEGPKKVAVFPFDMNSSQDLGFLQNGLFSMLSSRLADPGKVDVLDRESVNRAMAEAEKSDLTKGTLNEAKARMIGANIGVDYILFGSLTNFGESVSLDAKMVDVTGEKETIAFFEQSNAMGDVIPLVNSFAGDINQKVFNRRINNELYAQPIPQEAPAPGGLQHAGGAAAYGGGMMAMQQAGQAGFSTLLKSSNIITAMATGDLNNDGKVQVVAATDSSLMIYSMKGNVLALDQTLDYESYLRIVSLDIADINNNGYPEIFVSALTVHRDSLSSLVVEFDGSGYATLMDGESQYYRVIKTQEDTQVLLAQDKGSHPFSGRIHIMTANGDTYSEEKRIRMPRGTSVLSLAKGPVRDEDGSEYVMINQHDRLVVASDSGSMEWESSAKYGGTNNMWLMPSDGSDASYRDRRYINPRIKFYDIDGDGKPNPIVVKNSEIGGGTFGQYKKFKDGNLQVMNWNGIALAPVFQTMAVQGWISDFDIADLDGDGIDELVVSVVGRTKMSILSRDKSSNILSYKLK